MTFFESSNDWESSLIESNFNNKTKTNISSAKLDSFEDRIKKKNHHIVIKTWDVEATEDVGKCHYRDIDIKKDISNTRTLIVEHNPDDGTSSQIIMPDFSIIVRGYDPVSKSIMVSMRGGADWSPNVANICARFGGGGHPAAAGATIPIDVFNKCFHTIERA